MREDRHDGRDVRLEVVKPVHDDVLGRVGDRAVVVLDPLRVLDVVPLDFSPALVADDVVEAGAAVVQLKLHGTVSAVLRVERAVVLADRRHLPAAHAVVVRAEHVNVRRHGLVRGARALVQVVLVHGQLVFHDPLQLAHQHGAHERPGHLDASVAGERHHDVDRLPRDVVDERARVSPHELEPLAQHLEDVLARDAVARAAFVGLPDVALLLLAKQADLEDLFRLDRDAGDVAKEHVGDEVRQLARRGPRLVHALAGHADHDAVRVAVHDHVAFVLDGLFGVVDHAPADRRHGRRDVGDGHLALLDSEKAVRRVARDFQRQLPHVVDLVHESRGRTHELLHGFAGRKHLFEDARDHAVVCCSGTGLARRNALHEGRHVVVVDGHRQQRHAQPLLWRGRFWRGQFWLRRFWHGRCPRRRFWLRRFWRRRFWRRRFFSLGLCSQKKVCFGARVRHAVLAGRGGKEHGGRADVVAHHDARVQARKVQRRHWVGVESGQRLKHGRAVKRTRLRLERVEHVPVAEHVERLADLAHHDVLLAAAAQVLQADSHERRKLPHLDDALQRVHEVQHAQRVDSAVPEPARPDRPKQVAVSAY